MEIKKTKEAKKELKNIKQIKIITSMNKDEFQNEVNNLLYKGWVIEEYKSELIVTGDYLGTKEVKTSVFCECLLSKQY